MCAGESTKVGCSNLRVCVFYVHVYITCKCILHVRVRRPIIERLKTASLILR